MESFTSYNVRSIVFASSGGVFAGYGLSVIANTLGQPTFYETMSLEQDPTMPGYAHTTTITGAINGIFFAGGWIGAVSAGWLARALGRITGFRILCSIGLVGAVLQTGSVNVAMYLVARIIAGFGCGGVLASMPTYYTEIAPPRYRGIMVGAHACSVNFGYLVSGWIGYGCYFVADSTFSWRFPNALLVFFGLVFWTATFFIPESPRWLALNDRADKALEIMRRLHHDASDPDDTFARSELSLIVRQAAADAEAFARDGKWQLFTIPTYRKRITFSILLIAGTQNVGILVICNYAVSLYTSLGLGADMTLLLSALWMTVGCLAAFVGAYLSDKIGRRRTLVWGFISTVLVFSIATGLIGGYANTGSTKVAAAAVTFIFLYNAIYCSLVDVSAWTLLTEIFPSHLRSVAASLSISMVFLLEVLWLSLAPTAMREIGWKYYLVFASLGVAHCVYYWFLLPDTTGLPLEEIDLLFGKEVAGHLADGDIKEEFAANVERVEDLKQTAA